MEEGSMNLVAGLCNLDAPVFFFPVRHHSPAAARLVVELAQAIRPQTILIEGPADFNSQFEELYRPHHLPIAIYSYARQGDGRRYGAFYPFCEYSPEWQAILVGRELGAQMAFIDLPWAEMAAADEASHRYSDGPLQQSDYIPRLCRELGVEQFDDAWDALFEIDGRLDLPTYLERAHHLCYHIRALSPRIRPSDIRREAYMAGRIRQVVAEGGGRVLVVTGGFHSSALYQRLQESPADDEIAPAEFPLAVERGIALTPYTYARLDSLRGYEAGMPNPGFYHLVWLNQLNHDGAADTHRQLLALVAQTLRQEKQVVSAADLIAVQTMAEALALLRGHACVWRRDLVDAIIGALVKEELAYGYPQPFLEAVYAALRGRERGRLAAGTSQPPLVIQLQAMLANEGLQPEMNDRQVHLELLDSEGLARSRLLHQVRVLSLPGYQQVGGHNVHAPAADEPLAETWRIVWTPEFEAACIEAAIYGPTPAEAALARLQERAAVLDSSNAAVAAGILLDAALIGLPGWGEGDELSGRLSDLISQDGNFFTVSQALGQLLFLYRFDTTLGTVCQASVGDLLRLTFRRALWLLESLGVVGQDKPLLEGIGAILQTFERCGPELGVEPADFSAIFQRAAGDDTQTPLLRGAAGGVLWTLGQATTEELLRQLRYFADPEKLGDFLTGLFYLAREAAQRRPELVQQIDALLVGYDEEGFLTALPALRLAFSFFTPREKHYLAETLFRRLGIKTEAMTALAPLRVTAEQAAQVLAFEESLYKLLAHYGLEERP